MTQADGDGSKPEGAHKSPYEEIYLDQGRWLLEWHDRRSEAFMTRAVGLLGLVGVLDALLLQQVSGSGAPHGGWGWTFLGATLLSLTVAALFALLTLTSKEVAAPSVEQLREWWAAYLRGEGQPDPKADVTENVLHGTDLGSTSPVDAASTAATTRAGHFKVAVFAMSLSLLLLAALVLQSAATV